MEKLIQSLPTVVNLFKKKNALYQVYILFDYNEQPLYTYSVLELEMRKIIQPLPTVVDLFRRNK
jgi:hypothetical protein